MSALKEELVFVAAKRTAFGAFGGALAGLSATDLGVAVAKATIDSGCVRADEIDAVIFGNVVQSSKDAILVTRHIALKIGVPEDRPALTVNRLCGSGYEAIAQGAYAIAMEGAKAVLVGGTESMSQIPYVLRGARFGYRLGNGELEDYLTSSLNDTHVNMPMAITAENLAEKYKISRAQVDAFALESQKRAATAWSSGQMKAEIAPLTIKSRKGDVVFERDEHMRPESTIEGLAKLPALFKKDGVVTAGNASGMVDGASALVLTTAAHAKAKNWKPLARLVTWAAVGCDPKIMGIGPVPATRRVLERYSEIAGVKKTIADFKLIEVNEAFAAQYLAVEQELGLPRERTNAAGGAIAIGHPLGATGARIVAHLIHALPSGTAGLASACIGGGQGMSVVIEKL